MMEKSKNPEEKRSKTWLFVVLGALALALAI
jgi:hypothetical protein